MKLLNATFPLVTLLFPPIKNTEVFSVSFSPQILALEELHPKSKFTYILLILSRDYSVVSVSLSAPSQQESRLLKVIWYQA